MRTGLLLAAGLFAGGYSLQAAADAPLATPAADVSSVLSGTVHEALFSVALSGNAGVAVGAGGDIRETTDGGKTWTAAKVPSKVALLGVSLSGTHAIAVGLNGAVLVRDGQGAWTAVDSGIKERLLAVGVNGSGLAIAVGAFGTLIKSADAGQHWESVAPKWQDYSADGSDPNLYGVNVADDGSVVVAGEFGIVARSADAGATWESKHKGEATLFGLDLHSNGTGYAAGQDGTVLKTADRGQTWAPLNTGVKTNLLSVASTSDGTIYATAMHEIYVGRDDGQPWHEITAPAAQGLWHTSLAAADNAGRAFAVGQIGQILQLGK